MHTATATDFDPVAEKLLEEGRERKFNSLLGHERLTRWLFAAAFLEELSLTGAIVPIVPANFSAWGMLMIDIRHDMLKAVGKELTTMGPAELRGYFLEMEDNARVVLDRDGIDATKRQLTYSLDMRYVGQGHSVSVPFISPVTDSELISSVYASFEKVYQEVYGYKMNQPAEVVNLRIKATGEIAKPRLRQLENGGPSAESAEKSKANGWTRLLSTLPPVWPLKWMISPMAGSPNAAILGKRMISLASGSQSLSRK